MNDDEFEVAFEEVPERALEEAPQEPGPEQPEEYSFDDWALI